MASLKNSWVAYIILIALAPSGSTLLRGYKFVFDKAALYCF